MGQYEAKTKPEARLVSDFLAEVPSDERRQDAHALIEIYQDITVYEPVMWGPSIIGFGSYHYQYASGHQGAAPAAGFSPRAANLTLYFADGFEHHSDLLVSLGSPKVGKSCLYLKRLAEIDIEVLRRLIARSYQAMSETPPQS